MSPASPYRRIDLRAFGPEGLYPSEPEAVPRLAWIRIEDLVVDDRYQRPLLEANRAAIRRIAKRFTWRHFSPCLCADLGDGSFALIDGQHRAHAAGLAGFDAVPCLVVELSPERQAAAFAAVNGEITRVSPLQVFRAALAAGEPWARDCRRAVERTGAVLMSTDLATADRASGQVYAIGLVRQMVEAGQGEAVTRGLRALLAIPQGQAGWWPLWATDHLRPWLWAVAAVPEAGRLDDFHGELDWSRLVAGAERLRERPGYASRSVASILQETLEAMLRKWAGGGARP